MLNRNEKPVPPSLPFPFGEALRQRVKRWLFPVSPWLALLGVDGSGKSTVLVHLQKTAVRTGYTGLFVLHRRPQLISRPAANQPQGVIAHYGKRPHGRLLSAVKLTAIWLDWLLGYFLCIHRRRTQRVLVVADRHALLDMLVDPLRYRYGGSPRWVRTAVDCLPMPDGVILLDAPTAVVQARKQEITAEKTAELRRRYLRLIQEVQHGFVVDASQQPDRVTADIWQLIFKLENDAD